MPAIGMALLWGGYTLGMWGYCQLRGYQISIAELVIPGRWKGTWPPPVYGVVAPNADGSGSNTPQVPKSGGNSHPGDAPYTYPNSSNGQIA